VIAGGASAFIGSGGATDSTVINAGGLQFLDAGSTSTNTVIDGGYEYVGGTANATTITGGGEQYVGSGGTANGTHLVSGTEHVEAGGTAHDVDFAGSSGTLLLDSASGLTGTISNFELGDTIDLLNTSVTSFEFDGSTLTLATSGGSVSYQFADVEAGTEFSVASDGHGGTAISLSLLAQFSASLVPEPGAEGSLVAQDTTPTENTLANVQA
jgi:autotransporter passenger strand-loop-strand repeat protein